MHIYICITIAFKSFSTSAESSPLSQEVMYNGHPPFQRFVKYSSFPFQLTQILTSLAPLRSPTV